MHIAVPLTGVLYWQLIFHYNNSMNSAPITHSIRSRLFQRVSISTFMEQITEHASTHSSSNTASSLDFDLSASYKVLSASAESHFDFSEEIAAFVSTTREQKDFLREGEYEEIREYQVGANSNLELYQLYFRAPGISYACKPLSTVKKPDEMVNLSIKMKSHEFISNIRVVYGTRGSEAPPDRVREVGGLSDNINYGFTGYFVWLVPEYTRKVEDAVTGFDVFIGAADSGPDLAKGAGGAFRYLVPIKNSRVKAKITEVALMRRKSGDSRGGGPGFVGSTIDINQSRGGDWLYLIWKSVEA